MDGPDLTLGRRIAVRGATGSGKSTLARQLGEAMGLPVIELDALHWVLPGWREPDPRDFHARVVAALASAPDGWVCDGGYNGTLGDLITDTADTFVWLDLPWPVTFWRLLRRTAVRAWNRELLWDTQRESWRMSFASRDSILLWSITHHRSSRRRNLQSFAANPGARVLRLRSAAEVRRLLDIAGAPAGDA